MHARTVARAPTPPERDGQGAGRRARRRESCTTSQRHDAQDDNGNNNDNHTVIAQQSTAPGRRVIVKVRNAREKGPREEGKRVVPGTILLLNLLLLLLCAGRIVAAVPRYSTDRSCFNFPKHWSLSPRRRAGENGLLSGPHRISHLGCGE